jgi:hypothetical protein
VGLERGQLSLVRITGELLEWKSSRSGKSRITAVGVLGALSSKVGTNFAEKRRSQVTEFIIIIIIFFFFFLFGHSPWAVLLSRSGYPWRRWAPDQKDIAVGALKW